MPNTTGWKPAIQQIWKSALRRGRHAKQVRKPPEPPRWKRALSSVAFQAAGSRASQAPRSVGVLRLKSPVETQASAANICVMKLLYAFAAWIAMGTVLGA